jgi:hypothetical protein
MSEGYNRDFIAIVTVPPSLSAALYSPESFSGTHFCYRLRKPPRAMVRLERLDQLKTNATISSGIELATFRFVA